LDKAKLPYAKKAYGQNFIVNPGICPKMVDAAGVNHQFGVLEIGPGLGALTLEIAKRAKKVVAVEIDRQLILELQTRLVDVHNVDIVEGDILKLDLHRLLARHFSDMPVMVMGNLPYYITSPILMKLLEERLTERSVTVMVQREAARRLCAQPGTRQSGAITLSVHYYSVPRILFDVSPGSFFPKPKVTSSVIKLDVRESPAVSPGDERHMFAVVKAAFGQRRKTAVNAISAGMGLDKARVRDAIASMGLDTEIRPERLSLAQFAALSDALLGKR
jgi:16S rRNA (adenine1518-N6/adenine1519-N6)-dimethyltransferase